MVYRMAEEKWLHFSERGLRKKENIAFVAGILTAMESISVCCLAIPDRKVGHTFPEMDRAQGDL